MPDGSDETLPPPVPVRPTVNVRNWGACTDPLTSSEDGLAPAPLYAWTTK